MIIRDILNNERLLTVISNTKLEDLDNTMNNLLLLHYDTSRFVFSIAQTFYPINNSLVHQCELKVRFNQFKLLKSMQTRIAYLSFAGKGLFWIPGPTSIFSLGYTHIMAEAIKYKFALDVLQKEKQDSDNAEESDGLQEHTTNNYAPICASPKNPNNPVYVPKTIVDFQNIKSRLGSKQNEEKFLAQLNHIANMSVQERGKHLESLISKERITAQECKKQKWPSFLIGQTGVFARKDIPAFTVLGFYTGLYFMTKREMNKYKKENGTGYQTYVYSLPDVDMPRISAFIHGNDLSCVNAGTTYSGSAYKIAREILEKCSITAVYAKSLEFPDQDYVNDPEKFDLVTFVTNRPVKKGEQLLTDYGKNYWDGREENFTTATYEEIWDIYYHLQDKAKDKKNHSHIYKK